MAVKKPLVITNGQIEQLQAGDTIAHPGLFNRENANSGAIVKCQPVYVAGAGTVDLGQANALATADLLGLMADDTTAAGDPGAVQTDGVITATTGQWDTVTGQTGGLTPSAKYFLSAATAGMLTPTAPTADGQVVAPVGKALSTTELEIEIDQTIRL